MGHLRNCGHQIFNEPYRRWILNDRIAWIIVIRLPNWKCSKSVHLINNIVSTLCQNTHQLQFMVFKFLKLFWHKHGFSYIWMPCRCFIYLFVAIESNYLPSCFQWMPYSTKDDVFHNGWKLDTHDTHGWLGGEIQLVTSLNSNQVHIQDLGLHIGVLVWYGYC